MGGGAVVVEERLLEGVGPGPARLSQERWLAMALPSHFCGLIAGAGAETTLMMWKPPTTPHSALGSWSAHLERHCQRHCGRLVAGPTSTGHAGFL